MAEKVKNETNDVKRFFDNIANNIENNIGSVTNKVINAVKGTDINYNNIDDLSKNKLDELKVSLKNCSESDEKAINYIVEAFEYEIGNGNNQAKDYLNTFIKVIKEHPEFVIKGDSDSFGGSCYFVEDDYDSKIFPNDNPWGKKGLHFSNYYMENKLYGTAFHEIGHMLDYVITNNRSYANFDEVLNKAYNNYLANKDYYVYDKYNINKIWRESKEKIYSEYNLTPSTENHDKIIDMLSKKISSVKENSIYNLFHTFMKKSNLENENSSIVSFLIDKMGISREILQQIDDSNITDEELATQYFHDRINSEYNINTCKSRNNALQDILDAVNRGELWENSSYWFGHGMDYYNNNSSIQQEMIANYCDLRASNDTEKIEDLKIIIGKDAVNLLEATYKEFIKYGN